LQNIEQAIKILDIHTQFLAFNRYIYIVIQMSASRKNRRPRSSSTRYKSKRLVRPGTAPMRIRQTQTFYSNYEDDQKTDYSTDDDSVVISNTNTSYSQRQIGLINNYIAGSPTRIKNVIHRSKRYRNPPSDNEIVRHIISKQDNLSSIDFDKYHHLINIRTLNATCGALVHELVNVSLENYQKLKRTEMRALSTRLGDTLQSLNLSRSSLDDDSSQVLAHFSALKELNISYTNVTDDALKWICFGCSKTLISLSLAGCNVTQVSCDWLAGLVGYYKAPCKLLQSLDLSDCKRMRDPALNSISKSCHNIICLSVARCEQITDRGILELSQGCPKLRMLNCNFVVLLTNKALKALGANCHHLRSVRFDRCIYINDNGAEALANGCRMIESVSFAGCDKISEAGVCAIAGSCPNLVQMNLNGLSRVTENGLKHLCRGNPYLLPAVTYKGLKPRRNSDMLKVMTQEKTIMNAAAMIIQGAARVFLARIHFRKTILEMKLTPAVNVIRRTWRTYAARKGWRQWCIDRDSMHEAAKLLQRVYRRRYYELKAIRDMLEEAQRAKEHRICSKLQARWRGRWARRTKIECKEVADMLIDRKKRLKRRVENDAAEFLQRVFRGHFYYRKYRARVEEITQQGRDVNTSCLDIQCAWRCYQSRLTLAELRRQWAEKMAAELWASTMIQKNFRGFLGRNIAKEVRRERRRLLIMKIRVITKLQAVYRGSKVRQYLIDNHLLVTNAALKVQTKFRTHNAPSITELRLKLIDERIQKRYKAEQKRREVSVEERKHTFYEEMRHDSASEDEEEDWQEIYNSDLKRYVYYNKLLNEQRDTNPLERKFERALIGLKVKVRYPKKYKRRSQVHDMTQFEYGDFDFDDNENTEKEPERWYLGEVREYNATKDKHKIVFTAPLGQDRPPKIVYSREWIILNEDPTRIAFEIPTIDDYNEKVWTMYYQMDNDRERLMRIITGEAQAEEQLAIENALQEYEENKHGEFDQQQLEHVLQDVEEHNINNDDGIDYYTENDDQNYNTENGEEIYNYNYYTEENDTAGGDGNGDNTNTDDWEAFQDEDGNEYYYNHTTGESTWEYPW